MTDRATALAQLVQDSLDDLAVLIDGMSDAEWRATAPGEGWPVAVTAHHLASSNKPLVDFIELVANGQPLPPITLDMIHEMNAKHAQEFAECPRVETLELLRTDGSAAVSRIKNLGDGQLDRTASLPLMGGAEMSAQSLIEMLLVGHIKEHGGSIKTALGR